MPCDKYAPERFCENCRYRLIWDDGRPVCVHGLYGWEISAGPDLPEERFLPEDTGDRCFCRWWEGACE